MLTSVHDANIGSIFGIGFPAWTGGAMQFIASEGRERFIARRRRARRRACGERFALSPAGAGGDSLKGARGLASQRALT